MKAESPLEISNEYNEIEIEEMWMDWAESQVENAASHTKQAVFHALCVAQSLDGATEAYGSLTMASQSDPVPCLGYISSGMAALAWILENAELEELAAIAERVNDSMSDLMSIERSLKAKHDIEALIAKNKTH